MFSIRTPEANPTVVYIRMRVGKTTWETKEVKGSFHRVFPVDARENSALRMLQHHVEKFAPATGNGILITDEALKKFT